MKPEAIRSRHPLPRGGGGRGERSTPTTTERRQRRQRPMATHVQRHNPGERRWETHDQADGAITARRLRRVYEQGRNPFRSKKRTVAVEEISFTVPRGTIFGL